MREKNISKTVRDASDTSSDRRILPSEDVRPRVHWSLRPNQSSTSWDLDDIVSEIKRSRSHAVCIIEDLEKHPEWQDIGRRLALDGDFLDAHKSRNWTIRERRLWRWAIAPTPPTRQQLSEEDQEWRCIEGFYSLSTSRKTRISYHRYSRHVYLFLVSRPPAAASVQLTPTGSSGQRGRGRTCLRFNYSTSRIGLFIPPLFDAGQQPILNLFDFLKEAFDYTWPLQCLFIAKPPANRQFPAVRAHPLLYVLADFAWAHNYAYLDDKIKRISFQNIRTPTMDTVTSMHAFREDLDFLRAEAEQTLRHAPSSLTNYYEKFTTGNPSLLGMNETPLEALRRTADDANVLDGFLTNSLNLLIASIALRDSRRAEMLTWLAAVYVPLSFVTGIFGMNLRELNESALPVWICLEVLGVVLLVTLALVVMYKWWEKHRDVISGRSRRGREIGDGVDEP